MKLYWESVTAYIRNNIIWGNAGGNGIGEDLYIDDDPAPSSNGDGATVYLHHNDFGDLEIHAKLARGDLPDKRFDFSGTTLLLDSVVDTSLSEKQQEKLDAWFCDLEVGEGELDLHLPVLPGQDLPLALGLIERWRACIDQHGLHIRSHQEVQAVRAEGAGFTVETAQGKHCARRVILATGTRGAPGAGASKSWRSRTSPATRSRPSPRCDR